MRPGKQTFWWLAPAICAVLSISLGLWMSLQLQMPLFPTILESTCVFVFSFGSLTALFLLISAYPTKVGLSAYAAVAAIIIGGADLALHGMLGAQLYPVWSRETFPYRVTLYPAVLLLFAIGFALQRRMRELEQRYALQQDAAALLKEAELFKLRQQLQPHFLYNSLNSIASLMITAPEKAEEMTIRLSQFLRDSVGQGQAEQVALEEELDYLRNYLWIESVRFGDRLTISWDAPESLPSLRLPPFLLQPLLENAIKFGLYGNTGAVCISISILVNAGLLEISVTNPFDQAGTPPFGTGFGLDGIRRRLYLTYGRQDLLRTGSEDQQFTAT